MPSLLWYTAWVMPASGPDKAQQQISADDLKEFESLSALGRTARSKEEHE
jgi:hypothetical protein